MWRSEKKKRKKKREYLKDMREARNQGTNNMIGRVCKYITKNEERRLL